MTIPALIDKQDGFEIIRDKIASILAVEIASQQALATAAGKDPDLWKLRVYTERLDAWEQYLDDGADLSPLCNVRFDSSLYDERTSEATKKQTVNTTILIDCVGAGVSEDVAGGGFVPGGQTAAFAAQRAARLVRNIIMAGEYTYLGLRGSVWRRWPEQLRMVYPETQMTVNIASASFSLRVDHPEISPQAAESIIEEIAVDVKRSSDGEIIASRVFDYT